MSSGEADATTTRVGAPEPPPVPVLSRAAYPPFSMGHLGFRTAAKFAEWQIRERGKVLRCGWCKNLIEDAWGPGGMQVCRHVEGVVTSDHEVLPFSASR